MTEVDALLQSFPLLKQMLLFVGACRLFLKPLFSLLTTYVYSTESKSDDAFLNKITRSFWWKALAYALDLAMSVKVPK